MKGDYTEEDGAAILLAIIGMIFLYSLRIAAITVVLLWTAHFAVKRHIAPPIPCEQQIEEVNQ